MGGQHQAERPSDASDDQHDMDVDDTMIGIGEIQKLGVNAAGMYSFSFLLYPFPFPSLPFPSFPSHHLHAPIRLHHHNPATSCIRYLDSFLLLLFTPPPPPLVAVHHHDPSVSAPPSFYVYPPPPPSFPPYSIPMPPVMRHHIAVRHRRYQSSCFMAPFPSPISSSNLPIPSRHITPPSCPTCLHNYPTLSTRAYTPFHFPPPPSSLPQRHR